MKIPPAADYADDGLPVTLAALEARGRAWSPCSSTGSLTMAYKAKAPQCQLEGFKNVADVAPIVPASPATRCVSRGQPLTAAGIVLDLPEVPDWTPAPDAVAHLLTTGAGRTREAKRRQVLAALAALAAANPAASDREVARLASVDHKTVARIRGEATAQARENPHNAGEVTA